MQFFILCLNAEESFLLDGVRVEGCTESGQMTDLERTDGEVCLFCGQKEQEGRESSRKNWPMVLAGMLVEGICFHVTEQR